MADLAERIGMPPSPTKVVWNPEYDIWVERAAILLCAEAHVAAALPCSEHLREARREGNRLCLGMAPTRPAGGDR